MHEPLEGIADADARPRPAVPAPARRALPLARWVDVVQVAEHGAEVAWNLDDTRAGAPGRLALYAGLEPPPERDLPDAARGSRRGRDRRAHGRAARGAAVAAARHRAALGSATACTCASRPRAPWEARGAARAGAFGVGSRAHWAGGCIATRSSGWLGGALLALSVFLPWYGTDPDNRFAEIDGARGDQSCWDVHPILRWLLLAAAVAPFILAYIIARDHAAVVAARRDDRGRRRSPPSALILYNGVIDRPGEPSSAISLKFGWFLALLGVAAHDRRLGACAPSEHRARAQAPGHDL